MLLFTLPYGEWLFLSMPLGNDNPASPELVVHLHYQLCIGCRPVGILIGQTLAANTKADRAELRCMNPPRQMRLLISCAVLLYLIEACSLVTRPTTDV